MWATGWESPRPGIYAVFEKYDALPVFAQQSIRELNLTGRSYAEVLDAVTFAVFREDFQRGFGADGDHLKTDEEVEYALSNEFSMITLDCSEYIRNDVMHMSPDEVSAAYQVDEALEALYCGKDIRVGGNALHFSADEFRRAVLIYSAAIQFAERIYRRHVRGKAVDFEISIDETATPTKPEQHYFVANELSRRGVSFKNDCAAILRAVPEGH